METPPGISDGDVGRTFDEPSDAVDGPSVRTPKGRSLLAVALALIAAGCDGSTQSPASVVDREGEPYVVRVGPDDPALADAIANARSSVKGFVSQLPQLQADGVYVSVKAPVSTGNDVEHIWLSDLEYRQGTFYGTLGNEPLSAEIALGDPYSVAADQISDWMALRGNQLYGGFTIFAAREALNDAQRATFDESIGFRMPETPQTF
jgi:uncharacterized protein YegJ (DUF2314 family)